MDIFDDLAIENRRNLLSLLFFFVKYAVAWPVFSDICVRKNYVVPGISKGCRCQFPSLSVRRQTLKGIRLLTPNLQLLSTKPVDEGTQQMHPYLSMVYLQEPLGALCGFALSCKMASIGRPFWKLISTIYMPMD